MKKDKDIYIFGAGASAMAGLPIQTQIITRIFTLRISDVNSVLSASFMEMDEENFLISGAYIDFCKSRIELAKFIILLFGSEKDRSKMLFISNQSDTHSTLIETEWLEIYKSIVQHEITLEDVFTIFDKAYITTEYFREFSDADLTRYHNALKSCIIFIISLSTKAGQQNKVYVDFAKYLVEKRLTSKQSDDSFSIISMNWDTLLDYSIHQICIEINAKQKANRYRASIDYCCYDMNLDGGVPLLYNKVKKEYNIKLMKVHGSVNWLLCSNCGRLFTHHTSNIAIRNLYNSAGASEIVCLACHQNRISSKLRPVIVTPTFMKSLDSVPLKNIWHNASLDLSDASTVYFIGYSFPEADFELRYILKKSINSETKIKVVLSEKDSPAFYSNIIKRLSSKNIVMLKSRLNIPEYRYRAFFANNEIEFCYLGFENAFISKFIK